MTPDRLASQIRFLMEIDKLKSIVRQTWLLDQSRRENDAEHSWHLAVMAVLLGEYAVEQGLNLSRVIRMALVHDLVEIDAGDTYCYDEAGHIDKPDREQRAADRIFALLPDDQGRELRELWDEFEARRTPEARFAAAMDRLQPLLHNVHTDCRTWRDHGTTAAQVVGRCRLIADGSPTLWDYAEGLIRDAVERGCLPAGGE